MSILNRMPRTTYYAFMAAAIISLFIVGYGLGLIFSGGIGSEASTAAVDETPSTGGAYVDPPRQLQDFTLTSHDAEPISLSDLRDRVVVMFFGYTNCPDVCPVTLTDYTRVKASLGDAAKDVTFVFVSVDGERDTPEGYDGISQSLRLGVRRDDR